MGLQVTRAERNMQMRLGGKHMARTLMVWFIAFAMAAPVFADTKNGNANAGSWQRWRFTSPGGETRATITWTNTGVADLFATVVCGSSTASFVTSFTRGGFDRIVNLTYGLGAGFPCVIFVRTGAGQPPIACPCGTLSVKHSFPQQQPSNSSKIRPGETTPRHWPTRHSTTIASTHRRRGTNDLAY